VETAAGGGARTPRETGRGAAEGVAEAVDRPDETRLPGSSPMTRRSSFTRIARFASDTKTSGQTVSWIEAFERAFGRFSRRTSSRRNALGERWTGVSSRRRSRRSPSKVISPKRRSIPPILEKPGNAVSKRGASMSIAGASGSAGLRLLRPSKRKCRIS